MFEICFHKLFIQLELRGWQHRGVCIRALCISWHGTPAVAIRLLCSSHLERLLLRLIVCSIAASAWSASSCLTVTTSPGMYSSYLQSHPKVVLDLVPKGALKLL